MSPHVCYRPEHEVIFTNISSFSLSLTDEVRQTKIVVHLNVLECASKMVRKNGYITTYVLSAQASQAVMHFDESSSFLLSFMDGPSNENCGSLFLKC